MGKGKRWIGMLLIAALFFFGCQNVDGNAGEAGANNGKSEIPGQGGETRENQDPQGEKKASQKITEMGITEDKSGHPVTLKDGKAWGGLPVVGEEDAVYCNLQENIKETVNLVLLCPDPRYGMTYYVNYGEDYYIYAIKDGVAGLVVEIPAKRLFFREGKLYFMVETYGKYALDGLGNGDILSYDPVDGKVDVVVSGIGTSMVPQETSVTRDGNTAEVPGELAVAETSMTVYQDGIYYIQTGKYVTIGERYVWVPENKYFYSFATGETQLLVDTSPLSSLTFVRWGQSLAAWKSTGYEGKDLGELYAARTERALVDLQLQKERSLGFQCSPYFYLVGDKAYTVEVLGLELVEEGYSYENATSEIVAFDMETGEESRYPISRGEDAYTSAFFLFDGTMYFQDLISYSLTEGRERLAYCNLLEPNNLKAAVVSEYYTDGKGLYALCALDGKLYRVEGHEDSYTVKLPTEDVVYDYKFDFFPLGE